MRAARWSLSRKAGVFEDLGDDAIVTNLFDIEETARALHEVLTLHATEHAVRTKRLATAAGALTPKRCSGSTRSAVTS